MKKANPILPLPLIKNVINVNSGISENNLRTVYIITANKKIKYQNGNSKIIFIGTTTDGISGILQGIVERVGIILTDSSIKSVSSHFVMCEPVENIPVWKKLERALLIKFYEIYSELPKFNLKNGRRSSIYKKDEYDYFEEKILTETIKNINEISDA